MRGQGQQRDGASGATTPVDAGTLADVLLIATGTKRRLALAEALRLGLTVLAVESIAEVERWPRGGIVVTDYARSRRCGPRSARRM